MSKEEAAALRDAFISPNVLDSNFENANIVDVLSSMAAAQKMIARAILPKAAMSHDAAGGTVDSLTEAVMGLTAAGEHIAEALQAIAAAISDRAAP